MTRDNSPYYAQGREDGASDKALVSSCPGTLPGGMNPEMAWSVMYREGYAAGFAGAERHDPCRNCAREQA